MADEKQQERRSSDPAIAAIARHQIDLERRVENNEAAISLLVETSVAEGIRKAVADPKTWDAFFAALGRRAQDEAGSVAMAGIRKLLMHAFWWLIVGGVIYMFGGWTLLQAYLKKGG